MYFIDYYKLKLLTFHEMHHSLSEWLIGRLRVWYYGFGIASLRVNNFFRLYTKDKRLKTKEKRRKR